MPSFSPSTAPLAVRLSRRRDLSFSLAPQRRRDAVGDAALMEGVVRLRDRVALLLVAVLGLCERGHTGQGIFMGFLPGAA